MTAAIRRSQPLVLPALLGFAAALFLWQLGTSSLFIDEVPSIRFTQGNLTHLLDGVRRGETSPPTYWLLLDAWTAAFGASRDWIPRLPSALACVALVGVVWRTGCLLAGGLAGAASAILAALSAVVLTYAQEARPYALLMLAATITLLAVLEAHTRKSRRWLWGAAAAAVVTVSLHYVALAVLVPIWVWVLVRTDFSRRERVGFVLAPAIAFVAWVPLMLDQYHRHPNGGLGSSGEFTLGRAVRIAGSPFDVRAATRVTAAQVIGALAIATASAVLVAHAARRGERRYELVTAVALAPPVLLTAASLAGKDVLVTRYSSVAVPAMLVVVGVAAVRAGSVTRALLVVSALVAGILGTAASHVPDGRFPDTRAVATSVARSWRPGDVLVNATGQLGVRLTLEYYAERTSPRVKPVLRAVDPRLESFLRMRHRIWLVTSGTDGSPRLPAAEALRYRAARRDSLDDDGGLLLTLLEP